MTALERVLDLALLVVGELEVLGELLHRVHAAHRAVLARLAGLALLTVLTAVMLAATVSALELRLERVRERIALLGIEDRVHARERGAVVRAPLLEIGDDAIDLRLQRSAIDRALLDLIGQGEHQILLAAGHRGMALVGRNRELLELGALVGAKSHLTERVTDELHHAVTLRRHRSLAHGARLRLRLFHRPATTNGDGGESRDRGNTHDKQESAGVLHHDLQVSMTAGRPGCVHRGG